MKTHYVVLVYIVSGWCVAWLWGVWSNKEPNWNLCGVMTQCVGILYVYKMIYVYLCVASYNDMVLKQNIEYRGWCCWLNLQKRWKKS